MHEKLITEIPTIARYSRHNEKSDNSFRAFLKAGNVSNVELDHSVEEITAAVWSQIDCLKCANCCKSLEVLVDDNDIDRLAKRLKVTRQQFVRQYVGRVEAGVKYLRSVPCAFLGTDNKCTVYEDRPKACKDFPYLHDRGFRNRTLMMISNNAVCPIVFNVWQRLKNRWWGAQRVKHTT